MVALFTFAQPPEKVSSPAKHRHDWYKRREAFGAFVRHGAASLRQQVNSATVLPGKVASIV
jgi:hypothetical protein